MVCYDIIMHVRAAPAAGSTLMLDVGRSLVSWTPMPGNPGFDVVCGDLLRLRSSGGDFAGATDLCLANDYASMWLPYLLTVEPGQGLWFLVRESEATYDSSGPFQVGFRDAEIDASGGACP